MLTKLNAKYIQSLSHKKLRDEAGVFVAEGPKLLKELLAMPHISPVTIYATGDWVLNNAALLHKLPPEQVITLKPAELDRISFLTTSNHVLGVFKKPDFRQQQQHRIIVLDGIQDPGNLGTIVRIADWFGIRQIVCSPDTADVFNPKVVQSTMGSIGRVQVLYRDLKNFISEAGLPVYATTLDGKPMQETGTMREGIIVIGSEGAGIGPELLAMATHKITIPKIGQAESLNAAVATGIVLSHLLVQHGTG